MLVYVLLAYGFACVASLSSASEPRRSDRLKQRRIAAAASQAAQESSSDTQHANAHSTGPAKVVPCTTLPTYDVLMSQYLQDPTNTWDPSQYLRSVTNAVDACNSADVVKSRDPAVLASHVAASAAACASGTGERPDATPTASALNNVDVPSLMPLTQKETASLAALAAAAPAAIATAAAKTPAAAVAREGTAAAASAAAAPGRTKTTGATSLINRDNPFHGEPEDYFVNNLCSLYELPPVPKIEDVTPPRKGGYVMMPRSGRWKYVEKLGSGQHGNVYKMYCQDSGDIAAMKVMHTSFENG